MMFLTFDDMKRIYEKKKNGTATKEEIDKFDFNLMTGCFEPNFVIEKIEKELKTQSKDKR